MRLVIPLAVVVCRCWAQPPATPVQIPSPSQVNDLVAVAKTAIRKGNAEAALSASSEAWKLVDEGPRDDPRRYEAMRLLYLAHLSAQHYDEAEQWLTQAMDFRQRVDGPDSLKLANDLTELSMLCVRRQDLERAVAIAQRVQSIHVGEAKGFFGVAVADDFSRLGNLELLRKDPEQALARFKSALAIRENAIGTDHAGLLPDLDRIGGTQVVLRDYLAAEDTYRRAFALRSRMVGPLDPDLLPTLEGIAYSCFGQKKYAEAEPFYKQVLAIWEATGGDDHPMVALTEDKLAVFYREQEKWDEGEVHSSHALAIRARFLASAYAREAGVLTARNNLDGAIALYRRALATVDAGSREPGSLHEEIEKKLNALTAATSKTKSPAAPKRKPAVPAK